MDWSEPDAQGIRSRKLDVGAVSTLRGRRQRLKEPCDLHATALWPEEWRRLLRDWLGGSEQPRWSSLQKTAGPARVVIADELCTALLEAGWIQVTEDFDAGRWRLKSLRFMQFESQRERLGLPNRDRLTAEWAQRSATAFDDERLAQAAEDLVGISLALASRRRTWLEALQRWQSERRQGTRRDFALFAGGRTKAIPGADWDWLAERLDLPGFGVEAHAPMLLLRAPLRLGGDGIDVKLAGLPDFVGLTPEVIAAMDGVAGAVGCWRLVENRTSFERAARRYGDQDAVVWLPGYPPGWWRTVMSHLLQLCPAPARIAADPDPAGIAIAQSAAALWELRGLPWAPWGMSPEVLDRLPQTQPLSEADRAHLAILKKTALHQELADLAQLISERGIKGEQEGLEL